MTSTNLLKRKWNEFYTRLSAFFLVAMVILNATFMVPVHAAFVGPAVTAEMEVAVSSALGALGVGISGALSNADWKGLIDTIGNHISKDIFGGVTANEVGDAVQYHLTHDFLQSVAMNFNQYIVTAEKGSSLESAFPKNAILSQPSLTTPLTTEQFYSNLGYPFASNCSYSSFYWSADLHGDIYGYKVLSKTFYSLNKDAMQADDAFNLNGISYYCTNLPAPGQFAIWCKNSDGTFWKQFSGNYAVQEQLGNYALALSGYLVAIKFSPNDRFHYFIVNFKGLPIGQTLTDYPTNLCLSWASSETIPSGDTDSPSSKVAPYINANGNSVLPKTGDKTVAAEAVIGALEGTKVGHKTSTGTKDGVDVTLPSNANTANPSKLRDATATQTKVVGQEVADETDKTADDTYNQTNSRDTTPPRAADLPNLQLPTGLQKKFPFCLPWDLYGMVQLFNVTPVAPTWTVPVNIDVGLVHVHQTYVYDLNSNGVLDQGLFVFKWFLNISYTIGLLFVTRKIMA